MKVKFIAQVAKWFDKINGNTYHTVKITKTSNGNIYYSMFNYGYGSAYEETTLKVLAENKLIPVKYRSDENSFMYQRENNYPILFIVNYGTKKECLENILK